MKTGLQSLLVAPHTHSSGRGISFWLPHSRWVIQRKDSFNLLQQYSSVQACQKLQEEWWPGCWQPSNWVVESSSKWCVCANKCGSTSREICWGTERGSTVVLQCWMWSESIGLRFQSQQGLIMLRLLVNAAGKLQQRRHCVTGTRSSWKRIAKKRSLCPGNGTWAHKLLRRWEMHCKAYAHNGFVFQFSCSVPHNHSALRATCCTAGIQQPRSTRTSCAGPCFSKATTNQQQSCQKLHTGKHRQLANTASLKYEQEMLNNSTLRP